MFDFLTNKTENSTYDMYATDFGSDEAHTRNSTRIANNVTGEPEYSAIVHLS